MLTARHDHAMALLASGAVLDTAGLDSNAQRLKTAELFNPASRTFESAGSMVATRAGNVDFGRHRHHRHGLHRTALSDGRALIVGGVGDRTPTVPRSCSSIASEASRAPSQGRLTSTPTPGAISRLPPVPHPLGFLINPSRNL